MPGHILLASQFRPTLSSHIPTPNEVTTQFQGVLQLIQRQPQTQGDDNNYFTQLLNSATQPFLFDTMNCVQNFEELTHSGMQKLSEADKVSTVLTQMLKDTTNKGVEELEMKLNLLFTKENNQDKQLNDLKNQVAAVTSNLHLVMSREPGFAAKLDQLSESFGELQTHFEEKKKKKEEILRIKSHPHLKTFYLTFIQKMNQLLLACSVISR
jgi:hypothetical protein